jgi:hypothetical protein
MRTSAELYEAEGDGELPRPFEIESCEDLLQFPDVPEGTRDTPSGQRTTTEPLVDAIVVPTIRSAEHLYSAAKLAAHARCHLIAVYTDAPPIGLSAVLGRLGLSRVTVLTVNSGARHHLLDLGASLPQSLVSPAALDISRKRNLGQLLGRACGWTRMLFLDDDICKLNVPKLSSAAALLDYYPVVGFQVKKYPDASVVGHARRLAGRRQVPFVSGGSLLVNPQLLKGYFAPVYHEDWLCVINHLRKGEVAIGGSVSQQPYLPFSASKRAENEEFGDILLSGLLWLVHARTRKGTEDKIDPITETDYWRAATNPRFWKEILDQRAALLVDITKRLVGRDFEDPSPLSSLAAANQRLDGLNAGEFVSFTEEWLASLTAWNGRLPAPARAVLPDKARAIEKAIAKLGLAHVVRSHDPSSQRATAGGTGWKDGFADRCSRLGEEARHRFKFGAGNRP